MSDTTNPTPEPAQPRDPVQELRDWWKDTAVGDLERTLPKIFEYGGRGAAVDLLDLGHQIAQIAGNGTATDEEAAELGVYFYLRGKVARWSAAVVEGRRPSDDTLLDIVFYGMMARRIRAVGGWPVPR